MRCLPTLGGQTGLNTAVELAKSGVLERYGVELIGCDVDVIERGEDRKLFNECMADLGIEVSRAGYAYSVEDALAIAEELGYPVVLRPSFTMGGAGGGIARDVDELVRIVSQGLELSPAQQGAGGGVHRGLEGIRDGGHARRGRQRHHRLLHRESGPHGRAHRRLHHRGPGPDLDRPGIPAHARRVARSTRARGRCHGRLQRAVRRAP